MSTAKVCTAVRVVLATTWVILLAVVWSAPAAAQGVGDGPDVVVFDLMNTYRWGTSGDSVAYSVGTESCNRGTEPVEWVSNTNEHPVIAQNLYRLKDGRLEQIGLSWLKHGFVSVNGSSCDSCQHPPNGGAQLGVGCSDPYGASLNGSQSRLGPRHEVNAFTGEYPYPHSSPTGDPTLAGRIQVKVSDVSPVANPGALYFVEGQYVTADDAAAGNAVNNASYRSVTVGSGLDLDVQGPTEESVPAIYAWQAHDPEVSVVAANVPGEGRFHVAFKATDNGDGTWRFEYAVHNLNSHLSAGAFSVQVPAGVTVTDVGFHDVDYHSGEPWDGTDWSVSLNKSASVITWSTEDYAVNPEANALRWGTMYSFWFDADRAPEMAEATIGLFRPNGPSSVLVSVLGPGRLPPFFEDGFESGDLSAWSHTEP